MENDGQTPAAPLTQEAVQQAIPKSSFGDKFSAGTEYLWKNDKVFLIVFGVFIFLAYASSTLMDLITNKSNSDVVKTKEQDATLTTKETAAKIQSTSYEQAASQAAADEPQVKEDWNVKK